MMALSYERPVLVSDLPALKEIIVDNDPKKKDQMIKLSNGRITVPQVFFGENHIGGYDDLKRFHEEGKLNLLLKKNEN